jgi:hypothetical protein
MVGYTAMIDLPVVTSWGQVALITGGAVAGVKWGIPLALKWMGKNGPNGSEKRTYEAVSKVVERIETAETAIKAEVAETRHDMRNAITGSVSSLEDVTITGFKDLSQVMQRIEVILSRGKP